MNLSCIQRKFLCQLLMEYSKNINLQLLIYESDIHTIVNTLLCGGYNHTEETILNEIRETVMCMEYKKFIKL